MMIRLRNSARSPRCGMWLLIGLLQLIFTLNVYSFNLENRLPIYKFDAQNNSYFGYSLAIHHEVEADKKWILVGAPLGKNPQPKTERSGTLKRCPITQRLDDCEDVLTDGRQNRDGRYERSDDENELFEPLPNEIKENQWLGVTVSSQKSNSTNHGVILVCAHRYISKPGTSEDDAQHGIGLCYILGNDFMYDDVFEPCKGRAKDKLHEEYGVCQAGTSGALLDDGEVVLGSPGVFTWRGTLYSKKVAGSYLQRDKNIYYTPHEGSSPPIDKYSYLGMSVAAAKFYGDKYIYVGGAPRSQNHGQVLLFEKSSRPAMPMDLKIILDGEQFASGFGYQVATADINGDDRPDLLVSAPFYFDKLEGGAVYVYLNDEFKINKKHNMKLTGKLESRFGLALANIGDINKDFYEDIAIGAPYEGDGVVYIHLGSKDGLTKTPSQVIKVSDLGLTPNKKINTFGSYLTGGLDIDENGYPDLVVGAYNSSALVALLSRPIILFHTRVPDKVDLRPIDPSGKGCPEDVGSSNTCFGFQICCSIDPLAENPSIDSQALNIIYKIEAETFNQQKKFSRVYFGPNVENRTNIMKRHLVIKSNSQLHCENEVVYVKETARDIQSPIKFHLSYKIIEDELENSGLKRLNPILDQTQADRTFEATFQKDCGNDDICESKLSVEASLGLEREKNGQYEFVLGKSDDIKLDVSVINELDSAYEAQLFVTHQSSVTYIGASKGPVICNQFNNTVVVCTLGNPLKRSVKVSTTLRFDPSGLEDSHPNLSFRIFANSTSKPVDAQGDIVLQTNVIKQAELSIQGYARPPQVFYGGEIKGESAMKHLEDIGTSVVHTFQISNDGPWRAPFVEVFIDWPYQVGNDKTQGKWLLYLEDVPFVEGGGGGECQVITPNSVNPLNLIRKPMEANMMSQALMDEPALLRRTNRSHSFAMQYRQKESSVEKQLNESAVLNRVRRDRSMIIRADKLIDADGKKTNIVTMDCKRKTAKCVKIKCYITNIQRKTEAFIHVKSRLWNSTLSMDYVDPRVDRITIFSHAHLSIPEMYSIKQSVDGDATSIETHAYPELHDRKPKGQIPWWIIIVGICVGLILLALVAIILWKCGFFKRRRPDPTLSGNLEKNNESSPFIKK